jgi:hypothetical protein
VPACSASIPAPLRATGGQIPLTCNEIAAQFSTLIIKPVTGTRYRLRWRPGAAASTALNLATTGGKPGNCERNDLRLEYHAPHVRE